jgi:probable rRNA maturation factor
MGKILRGLGYPEAELSLLFTGDEGITELNRRYLKRDKPTNVLAFPMIDAEQPEVKTSMLGDIVISLDAALREAQACGESLEGAIDRLLVHGLVHLLGYDHEGSRQEARRMQKEEKRLLAMTAGPGPGMSELDEV